MFEIFFEFIKNMLLTGAYQNQIFKPHWSKFHQKFGEDEVGVLKMCKVFFYLQMFKL